MAPESTMAVWSPWLQELWALRGGGGGKANIRRSINALKMRYFNCNIFYVSGPSISQTAFRIWWASASILG